MKDSDIEVLNSIVKYCNDIDSLMKKYNSSFETYETDISFQYSCNMCIIQIGELVGRLSDEFIEGVKHIPWHAIKGMRNLHAHDYENVDLEIVWNSLTEDIPEKYKKMLASEITAEKQRLFQEIKSKPTEKRVKKTGCKKNIVFNFS